MSFVPTYRCPATPTRGLQEASQILRSDTWDAEGVVSVYLPRAAAIRILTGRGWSKTDDRQPWMSPDRRVTCWETDEALQLALLADVAEGL